MFPGIYRIYGAEPSYFTRKVEGFFRYMDVPYELHFKTPGNTNVLEDRAGTHVIPVVETPEDWMLWDSTPIGKLMNDRFPDHPIIPPTPAQKITCLVFENWFDEWFTRPALHYRWNFQETADARGRAIAANLILGVAEADLTVEQGEAAWKAGQAIAANFGARATAARGAGQEHASEIESRFETFLDLMEEHFRRHSFLMGDRPCLADFTLLGAMKAHFGIDPAALRVMRDRGPGMLSFMELLWDMKSSEEAWLEDDEIPETLAPLIDEMMARFHVQLAANRTALADAAEAFEVDLGFGTTRFSTNAYEEKARLDVKDELDRLDSPDRSLVDATLATLGVLDVYNLPEVGQTNEEEGDERGSSSP